MRESAVAAVAMPARMAAAGLTIIVKVLYLEIL